MEGKNDEKSAYHDGRHVCTHHLAVWGIWQLLSGILGGGVQESFLYPIYGGVILLSGLIVVCTELILEEIKSLKADITHKNEEC